MEGHRTLYRSTWFWLPLIVACQSPQYRDQGALIGGLTGAGIGAAVGQHNKAPLAGTAIGAAVGTLAGAAVGDAMDSEIARRTAEAERQAARQSRGAVTIAQVISMTRAGLSDDVIISHIQANGVAQRPTADDLIVLKNEKVSDRVILALQQQPIAAPAAKTTAPPVVVERYYYSDPWWPPSCWGWNWHCPPRHHHGIHWGITVGR